MAEHVHEFKSRLILESAAPHKMLNVVLVRVRFSLVAHFCFLNSELLDYTIELPDELLDYTIEHNFPSTLSSNLILELPLDITLLLLL